MTTRHVSRVVRFIARHMLAVALAVVVVMTTRALFDSDLTVHHYDISAVRTSDGNDELTGSASSAAGALEAFAQATSPDATDALMCQVLQVGKVLRRARHRHRPPSRQRCTRLASCWRTHGVKTWRNRLRGYRL